MSSRQASAASADRQTWLTDLTRDVATDLGVVGAQVSVFDGEHQVSACFGTANMATGAAVTDDTLFQIGSTTKVYNAVLAMQLVDEGLADLDQRVVELLPWFALHDDEATRVVTLAQLLSMTSGIDNGPYADHGPGDDCVARYVAALRAVPMISTPGTMYGYSNASTIVAGHVVEHIRGESWDSVLLNRVLGPAGLNHSATRFEQLVYQPVAVGYARGGEAGDSATPVVPWALPRAMSPAGSTLCATATDLAAFGRMFLDGGRVGGTRILSRNSVAVMHDPRIALPRTLIADEWCVGPYRRTWDGVAMYGHSGTNLSSSSLLVWIPQLNAAIATLVNVPVEGYPFADAVLKTVMSELFGVTKPGRPQTLEDVPDCRGLTGTYEAHATRIVIDSTPSGLAMRVGTAEAVDLRALSSTCFLPGDLALSGGRGWAVGFVLDESGRASHLVNGVFTARRVA